MALSVKDCEVFFPVVVLVISQYAFPFCTDLFAFCRDWNEHRLICGFRAMTTPDSSAIAYLTYPKRFLDAGKRDPSASCRTDSSLQALITSRDLSDYMKGVRLRTSETMPKLIRLRDESRRFQAAQVHLTQRVEERRRQLREDQSLTEGQIKAQVNAEFIQEQKDIHGKMSELSKEIAEVIRWSSWVADCRARHKPAMQMMLEDWERVDRG